MYSPYKLYTLHLNKQGNKNFTADIYHVHLQVHTTSYYLFLTSVCLEMFPCSPSVSDAQLLLVKSNLRICLRDKFGFTYAKKKKLLSHR